MKLKFKTPKTGYPHSDLVSPSDPRERLINAYMCELGSLDGARRLRDELRDVIARKRDPTEGASELFWEEIGPTETHIAKLFAKIPTGDPGVVHVTIPTTELLDLVEQWIAYVAREYPSR